MWQKISSECHTNYTCIKQQAAIILWLTPHTAPIICSMNVFFAFSSCSVYLFCPQSFFGLRVFLFCFVPSRNFLPPTALETIADFSENFFFMSICLLVLIEKKVMIIILISVLLSFSQAGRSRSRCHDNFLFVCCDYAAARGNDCDWRRTVNKLTKLNKNRIKAITSYYITSLIN